MNISLSCPTALLHADKEDMGWGLPSLITDNVALNATQLSTSPIDKGHLGTVTQALLASQLNGRGGATVSFASEHAQHSIGLRQLALIN